MQLCAVEDISYILTHDLLTNDNFTELNVLGNQYQSSKIKVLFFQMANVMFILL